MRKCGPVVRSAHFSPISKGASGWQRPRMRSDSWQVKPMVKIVELRFVDLPARSRRMTQLNPCSKKVQELEAGVIRGTLPGQAARPPVSAGGAGSEAKLREPGGGSANVRTPDCPVCEGNPSPLVGRDELCGTHDSGDLGDLRPKEPGMDAMDRFYIGRNTLSHLSI